MLNSLYVEEGLEEEKDLGVEISLLDVAFDLVEDLVESHIIDDSLVPYAQIEDDITSDLIIKVECFVEVGAGEDHLEVLKTVSAVVLVLDYFEIETIVGDYLDVGAVIADCDVLLALVNGG